MARALNHGEEKHNYRDLQFKYLELGSFMAATKKP